MERDFPRPSLLAVMALVLGMVWGRATAVDSFVQAGGIVALAVIVAAVTGRLAGLRVWGMIAAFAALGALLQAPLNRESTRAGAVVDAIGERGLGVLTLVGTIDRDPRPARETTLLWLAPGAMLRLGGDQWTMPAPLAVRVRGRVDPSVAPGDEIHALGRLTPIADQPNPREFDSWLASQGAAASVRAAWFEVTPAATRPWHVRSRLALRHLGDDIQAALREQVGGGNAAILSAMLLGRTEGLTPLQRERFRRAGLMHLFAVSGLHTGVIAVSLLAAASALGLGVRLRVVVVLGGLLFFVALSGFRPSAMRAALVFSVFLVQPLLRREIDPLGALSSVALVLLAASPRLLWMVDFQMTFLCALALTAALPGATCIEENLGPRLGWTWWGGTIIGALQTIFVSTAVQLALAPILVGRFGEFSLVAPLANVLALPVAGLMIPCAAAGLVLLPVIGFAGSALLAASDVMAWLISLAATACAGLPSAALTVALPWPPWAVGGWYALLLAGRWVLLRPRFTPFDGAASATVCMVGALAVAVWVPVLAPRGPLLRATFLDVGQGDAILLEIRDGERVLVDAGADRSGAIVRELHALGIRSIDTLVLTHADADHIGGADHVLEHFDVGRVLTNGLGAGTGEWASLAREALYREVPVTSLERGAIVDLGGGVRAEVLHPAGRFVHESADRNEASIVLRVVARDFRLLLTGDAEHDAEADMLAAFGPDALMADVLKAGHHGSKSSTTMPFLVAVAPEAAVLSCGRGNRYGHPSPDVMARLAEMGVETWRTDLQGNVVIETDGMGWWGSAERAGAWSGR
jgi:competence protein ComEC